MLCLDDCRLSIIFQSSLAPNVALVLKHLFEVIFIFVIKVGLGEKQGDKFIFLFLAENHESYTQLLYKK